MDGKVTVETLDITSLYQSSFPCFSFYNYILIFNYEFSAGFKDFNAEIIILILGNIFKHHSNSNLLKI